MSKIYDFRDDLKTAIVEADLGLDESDIVIERQADIINKINSAVAKKDGNGVALTIGAAGGQHVNPESVTNLTFEVTFELQLWVLPIYRLGTMPEEDIFEPLLRMLHGKEIGGGPQHCSQTLKVISFRDVADPKFLVREISLKRTMTL